MKKRLFAITNTVLLVILFCTTAFAVENETGFSDVAAADWYAEAVSWCSENGIMSGTTGTTFSPHATMTRSMLAAVLYRAAGSPVGAGQANFADVPSGQWDSAAVSWAAGTGIMGGYGGGLFGRNDPVTREQIAAILWRYAGSPTGSANASFADSDTIAVWAVEAVNWARAEGIIHGRTGNRFDPKTGVTRAEAAVILHNYLDTTSAVPIPDEAGHTSLVVYYSWSGNTRRVAERIAARVGADLYEIRTVNPYPEDGHETSVISVEERRTGNLPELVDDLPSISDYDTIYIGGPIWNAYMPTPLESYLEQVDFTGKTVIPFSTSQGSGQTGYQNDFAERVQNPASIGEYRDFRFPGNYSPDAFSDRELDALLDGWLAEGHGEQAHFIKDVALNNGYTMPVLGLGTWTQDDETVENSVYAALQTGYRLIDTARYYGNEKGVGAGVRRAIEDGIVTREEVFVTSKIMPSNYNMPDRAIDQSNTDLGLGYIDLMLVHQPGRNDVEVYHALERGVRDGKIRSIGISNYYTREAFDRITANAEIMPVVVQNENHPYFQNTEFQEYVSQYGVVVESYYPFGGRGHTQELFGNETLMEIAAAHNKTPAQVILRWQVQAGYIAIPGSSNPEHIAENYAIFDFELTEAEMNRIAALNRSSRYGTW